MPLAIAMKVKNGLLLASDRFSFPEEWDRNAPIVELNGPRIFAHPLNGGVRPTSFAITACGPEEFSPFGSTVEFLARLAYATSGRDPAWIAEGLPDAAGKLPHIGKSEFLMAGWPEKGDPFIMSYAPCLEKPWAAKAGDECGFFLAGDSECVRAALKGPASDPLDYSAMELDDAIILAGLALSIASQASRWMKNTKTGTLFDIRTIRPSVHGVADGWYYADCGHTSKPRYVGPQPPK